MWAPRWEWGDPGESTGLLSPALDFADWSEHPPGSGVLGGGPVGGARGGDWRRLLRRRADEPWVGRRVSLRDGGRVLQTERVGPQGARLGLEARGASPRDVSRVFSAPGRSLGNRISGGSTGRRAGRGPLGLVGRVLWAPGGSSGDGCSGPGVYISKRSVNACCHFPSPPGSVRVWAHEGALLLGGCGENRAGGRLCD